MTKIDATAMEDIDIAEMVADSCAMSEELHNNPVDWAKSTINKKWEITKHQVDLTYKLLIVAWRDNEDNN